jgi:hypothetical protein
VDGLVVVPAAGLSSDQLGSVAASYEQAFPAGQRVPFAELCATGPADLLLVLRDGGAPAGFASLRLLGEADWAFLRYFAIRADRRRTGLGQRFWPLVRRSVLDAGWPSRIVFEVEDPAHAADEDQRLVSAARIEFWKRCGCDELPVSGYVMPSINGTVPPEPMLLMAADPAAPTPMPAGQVRALVRAVYHGRYQLDPGHPLVRAALASVGG